MYRAPRTTRSAFCCLSDFFEPGEMFFEVGVGMRGKRKIGGFGGWLEVGVIGEDTDDVAVEFSGAEVGQELIEAVALFRDEQRDFLFAGFRVEMDFHLHVDLFSQVEQTGDDFGEAGRELFQIDEHVHDEEAANDALLDVLDIDAALGHVGRELRDDAFLVFSENADDG